MMGKIQICRPFFSNSQQFFSYSSNTSKTSLLAFTNVFSHYYFYETFSIYIQICSTGTRTHQIIALVDMIDDMHDYGVYTDTLDIAFDVEELEDSDVNEDERANENNTHHRKIMTDLQRQQIYEALLERSNRGRLQKNATTIVAQKFQVSTSQVRSVWRRAKQCRAQGRPVDVRSRRKNCGRKRKQIDLSAVLSIPLRRRKRYDH
jgi:hypothetical protein